MIKTTACYDSAADLRHLGKIWAAWHVKTVLIQDPLKPKVIYILKPPEQDND